MKGTVMISQEYTATSVVLAIGSIHIEGNIIPHTWYGHLKTSTGTPHTTAILILSEVLYWYQEEEPEPDGTFQRSYAWIANRFGFTKGQVREAIHYLENKGLIHTDLRTIDLYGVQYPNTMFIRLDVEAVLAISQGGRPKLEEIEETPPLESVPLHIVRGNIRPSARERVLQKTGGRCAYCGTELYGEWHVEHLHPRCQGGTNRADNLMAACARCNGEKGGRTVEQFRRALAREAHVSPDQIRFYMDTLEVAP